MRKVWWICLMGLLAGGFVRAQERTGYRIWRGEVVVEGREHWIAWESGEGARIVEEDGSVRPRFMRRDINAVLNAAEFINVADGDTTTGGISAMGVAADSLTAPLIIDGDMDTWWEPDVLGEHLENLWVEIDLGRAVVARRIVVRFVEEGKGDPFLKFRVLVSDGTRSFGSRHRRRFVRIGQVALPNKDQREFTFEVEPFRPVPEGIEGELIQFVRIDLLDTDGLRGRQVSRERYILLPPEDKGAIEYFRRTVSGREIPVVEETYHRLPPEERGEVRYYRREHPRLAEVEVHALGDNVVALTQRALFEEGDFFSDIARRFVTDGLLTTAFPIRVYNRLRNKEQITIDLGAKFWLDRIRLVSLKNPLTSYQIRVSDGSLDVNGGYLWRAFEEHINQEEFTQLEECFPLREVRLIELRRLDLLGEGRLAEVLNEIQAYGEGYVSEVTMTSPIIKVGQRRIFTRVYWDASTPPGTSLQIRTRSGDELIQIPHYFNRDDREISEAMYERLSEEDRGPIRVEEQPGSDWSTWSEPYSAPGDTFKSPTPRKMAMVQVRLSSTEPLRFASIRRLSLDFEEPLVDRAVAEIWPIRRVRPGMEQEFRLYVRPLSQDADPGFDRLRLISSSVAPVELISVRRGEEMALRSGEAVRLWPGDLEVETREDGSLELEFPRPVRGGTDVLELTFRTKVFLPGTTFRVELRNRAFGDRVQVVDPGDASAMVSSNSLVVVSDLSGLPLVGGFEVHPSIFTPNGDGVNDQAAIEVSIFQIENTHWIRIEIFDLSGRKVRDLSLESDRPSGEHRIPWDGRDAAGHLLPPGIYLVRLFLSTDSGSRDVGKVRPVHLVY